MNDFVLHRLTVAQLGELVQSRQVSPVEIAEAFIDRATKLQPTLNAFITTTYDQALAKASLAEAEIMKTAATHDSKWEIIMAQGTQNSWKDELVTIVVLIPCVLTFIPGLEEVVKNGFQRLNELPDWYQYLLFLVCSAALGIRGLDKWKSKK